MHLPFQTTSPSLFARHDYTYFSLGCVPVLDLFSCRHLHPIAHTSSTLPISPTIHSSSHDHGKKITMPPPGRFKGCFARPEAFRRVELHHDLSGIHSPHLYIEKGLALRAGLPLDAVDAGSSLCIIMAKLAANRRYQSLREAPIATDDTCGSSRLIDPESQQPVISRSVEAM